MERTVDVISIVVYGGLALVAARFAIAHRTSAGVWAAATFGALACVVVIGAVAPPVGDAGRWSVAAILRDISAICVGAFPYLLHRFTRALAGRSRTRDRTIDLGFLLIVASLLILPPFPEGDAAQPAWVMPYTIVFLIWWVGLLSTVSLRLWRMGSGQPGMVQGRTRFMAGAALLMNLALIGSVFSQEEMALRAVASGLGWLAALGFMLGLQPLPLMRSVWRSRDEVVLREAEAGLITAVDPSAAARAVVDAAAAVVGGAGAKVTDAGGLVLAEVGTVDEGRALRVGGEHTVVTVTPSKLTPVLGHGEEALLRQLCGHLDLVIARLDALAASEAARAQAEQANTDLQHLVYGVSHDLRNPLVTISGFLNLLERQDGFDEHTHMLIDRIAASAKYMQGLVDDLLQLSRVGHADAERTDIPLGPLVRGLQEDLQVRYPQLQVEVDPLPSVHMNVVRARQLFANLLENAARYAGPDGEPVHVSVSARDQGDGWVTIDVADDGPGIPPDQRERIFQIFQRLEGFDVASEGSGIGLTMCRRIVTDVGGTIGVADTETGMTMRMTLPLHAPVEGRLGIATR